ncbi:hypothetical protein BaRGS_00029546 [Batillaria attramentaria]|uniref:Uncharacterized protein n=1 Tax=Batillaria attramentaria TaxID=370345 RepID=A0ABD0JW48_9CAEN
MTQPAVLILTLGHGQYAAKRPCGPMTPQLDAPLSEVELPLGVRIMIKTGHSLMFAVGVPRPQPCLTTRDRLRCNLRGEIGRSRRALDIADCCACTTNSTRFLVDSATVV